MQSKAFPTNYCALSASILPIFIFLPAFYHQFSAQKHHAQSSATSTSTLSKTLAESHLKECVSSVRCLCVTFHCTSVMLRDTQSTGEHRTLVIYNLTQIDHIHHKHRVFLNFIKQVCSCNYKERGIQIDKLTGDSTDK